MRVRFPLPALDVFPKHGIRLDNTDEGFQGTLIPHTRSGCGAIPATLSQASLCYDGQAGQITSLLHFASSHMIYELAGRSFPRNGNTKHRGVEQSGSSSGSIAL